MSGSRAQFALAGRTIAVDLPHLAFVTAIAGWCVWFCADAAVAQARIGNLIMILPATLAAVALYLVIAAGCFHVLGSSRDPGAAPRAPLPRALAMKIAGAMALLAAFTITAPLLGFDVATFAYVLATLWLLGERRLPMLLLLPAVFCAVMIYAFNTILATPLPLLLLPGGAS